MCSVRPVLDCRLAARRAPHGAILALSLLAAGGCQEAPEGPEAIADRFMALVRTGGSRARTAAWDLLTPDAQASIRAQREALDEAAGRAPKTPPDGAALLAGLDLEVVTAPGSASLVSPPGDQAAVKFSGGPGTLHLARIDGRWRVDLWRSLVPTSTATAPRPTPPE